MPVGRAAPLVRQRTALINALRGHLAELGIVVTQGARNARQLIEWIQDEANPDIPLTARIALQPLAAMLVGIEAQITRLDKAILAAHRSDPTSVRLATIPGTGPMFASCLSASVPDAGLFRGSREFAAYLGLVPRQHSTGGKPRLGSISKMGNRHLRMLLVVGAHAALYSMKSGRTRTVVAEWAAIQRSKSVMWNYTLGGYCEIGLDKGVHEKPQNVHLYAISAGIS